jgi:serine/threonine-protein kinase
VKPANIMLCHRPAQGEIVKVLDFGLAVSLAGDAVAIEDAIVGTPLYLAPETISGGEVTVAADLYALGAVAYFLLAGEAPFPGESVVAVCAAHLHQKPTPFRERTRAKVSPALEALVMRCLAKDPSKRPASALELERSLGDCGVPACSSDAIERFWQDGEPVITLRRAARPWMRARPADATRVAPHRRSIHAEVGQPPTPPSPSTEDDAAPGVS